MSLNYGPDYNSDLYKNIGDSFVTTVPFISWQFGLECIGHQKTRVAGVREFYVHLSAKDYPNGMVLEGTLEYSLYF